MRQQYAPVGNAGTRTLIAEQHVLAHARERLSDLDELAERTSQRLTAMQQYVREYPAILLAGPLARRLQTGSIFICLQVKGRFTPTSGIPGTWN